NNTSPRRTARGPLIEDVFRGAGRLDQATRWEKAGAGFGLVFLALMFALSIGNDFHKLAPFLYRRPHFVRRVNAAPTVMIEFRRAETTAADGLIAASIAGTAEKVYLHSAVELSNADIADTAVEKDTRSQPMIIVTFTAEGKQK